MPRTGSLEAKAASARESRTLWACAGGRPCFRAVSQSDIAPSKFLSLLLRIAALRIDFSARMPRIDCLGRLCLGLREAAGRHQDVDQQKAARDDVGFKFHGLARLDDG